MTILIVDDDPGLLNALRVGLTSCDYQVVTARNGRQALDIIVSAVNEDKEKQVEFLLADLRMSGMDGLSLIHSARKAMPRLPAILMTAYGEKHIQKEVTQLKGCGYIDKPFRLEALMKVMQEAASRSQ